MTSLEHRLHISNRNGFNWPEKSYDGFNGENLTHGMNPALPGPKRYCLWNVRHIKYFVFSRLLEAIVKKKNLFFTQSEWTFMNETCVSNK